MLFSGIYDKILSLNNHICLRNQKAIEYSFYTKLFFKYGHSYDNDALFASKAYCVSQSLYNLSFTVRPN